MSRLIHLSLLVPALLVAACGEKRDAAETTTADLAVTPNAPPAGGNARSGYAVAPGDEAVAVADSVVVAPAEPAPATNPAAPGTLPAPATQTVTPAMIIRTGTATVQVDKLEPAMQRVEQLARRLGGYVANSNIETGDQSVRQATLEMKLPAARWSEAVAGLQPIGKLESQQTNAEDVGEEYVDVTARMTNARRMQDRLLTLLDTHTGKLDDVLAVERELSRVREEIERYEGRLRFLRTRAAVSTLTVRLHEPLPVLAPGRSPILDAFREAWRNFIGFTAGLIAALGWLIPLVLVFAAVAWLLRWLLGRGRPGGWRERMRGPAVTPHGPPPPPPPPGAGA
ncbi:MAG TPA: DUF4349 domain-containing protein [Longimicrobiaceae bacterium]|nr:DUF4349 domain-containing protein [Longimicrobiaceae bacterium]